MPSDSKISRMARGLRCVLPPPHNLTQLARLLYWLATFKLASKIKTGMRIDALRRCLLFDAAYYLRHNPDVAQAGVDAAAHFVNSGWREKRQPHPLFDTAYYLEQNPGVAASGLNPLLHFIATGGREGRSPHTLFDSNFYLGARPDVNAAGVNPLLHYLTYGTAEGADPHPLFSTNYYLERNPDVARAGINPLVHYVTQGAAEGRTTHACLGLVSSGQNAAAPGTAAAQSAAALYHAATHNRGARPDPNLYRFQWDAYEVLDALQRSDIAGREQEFARAMRFSVCDKPDISIVIPVYNKALWTLRCLRSLQLCATNLTFEIIVVDDASTDETRELIGPIEGVRYARNSSQLGFLRSCNLGAGLARGEFLVLLNNDTVLLPGWLDALRNTFNDFEDCGLAGSKLLYPDGRLQEAGGIVWRDGSGLNVGRLQDPAKPEFCYARDVDYCSGASLMLPRKFWNELGGFDEAFAPAYYEDTDLAFRLRRAGRRVLYQPLSKVIHFEGVSSGTDTAAGVKRFQAVNQPVFFKRWEDTLKDYGSPSPYNSQVPLQRLPLDRRSARRALVIDDNTPTPDQDSGSVDTINYLTLLKQLRFHVTFIPAADLLNFGGYTRDLQRIGVECRYAPYTTSVEEYLKAHGHDLDLVLFFRYTTAAPLLDVVRAHAPRAKVVLETVDLHFLRQEREALLEQSAEKSSLAQAAKRSELETIRACDASIVLSDFELNLLRELVPGAKLALIPIARGIPGRQADFEQRRGIAFIGGFRHAPNIDAVLGFAAQVWPLIRARIPGCIFSIAGSNAPKAILNLAAPDIEVLGFVEDLSALFASCRLTVAPLRYGAGIKGKVVTSLSYGVPCVASPAAVEGMGLTAGENVLVGATPREFADAVLRLYDDGVLWNALSERGVKFAREKFSMESAREKFAALLQELL